MNGVGGYSINLVTYQVAGLILILLQRLRRLARHGL